ncbi:hypothetical protein BPO_2141 [Bergeyella porcorum]|uniref:Uncharacterized protein n=1 Tax=Bergeyella porcorum TaxID=1735111 RepID=A0AAU0F3Y3_9FLAO
MFGELSKPKFIAAPTLLLWKKSNAMEVENWFKSLNFVALKMIN